MPRHKLIYFDGRGRGETIRMLFSAGGIDFEDFRIKEDEMHKVRSVCPMGQIPVLEIDGYRLCQSRAIMRYAAKLTGFAGEGVFDQAKADMVVDILEDITAPLIYATFEGNLSEEEKEKVFITQSKDRLPGLMEKFEALLKLNNGGDGYFVSEKMTYADIEFTNVTYFFDALPVQIDWSKYPKLAALKERVKAQPKIKEWIDKRPVTRF